MNSWDYTKYRRVIGITHAQFKAVVAIMAHVNAFGVPVPRKDLAEFLDDDSLETAVLERSRWIERTCSNPLTYRPTARAWREFGVKQTSSAA